MQAVMKQSASNVRSGVYPQSTMPGAQSGVSKVQPYGSNRPYMPQSGQVSQSPYGKPSQQQLSITGQYGNSQYGMNMMNKRKPAPIMTKPDLIMGPAKMYNIMPESASSANMLEPSAKKLKQTMPIIDPRLKANRIKKIMPESPMILGQKPIAPKIKPIQPYNPSLMNNRMLPQKSIAPRATQLKLLEGGYEYDDGN